VRCCASSGLEPEDHEALVIGTARDLATDAAVPDGLRLRTVDSRADLDRVAAMESEVWAEDWSWLADDLVERIADPHAPATVYVVEDGDRVVSAGLAGADRGHPVRRALGRSTLADYRGRGLYRALVARAPATRWLPVTRLLQVDASDDSRPILERLGLHVVGGTTPYIWTPPLTA
jgi:hypothetical protein